MLGRDTPLELGYSRLRVEEALHSASFLMRLSTFSDFYGTHIAFNTISPFNIHVFYTLPKGHGFIRGLVVINNIKYTMSFQAPPSAFLSSYDLIYNSGMYFIVMP